MWVTETGFFTENKKGDMDNRLGRFCLLASFVLPLGVYFYTAAPGPYWEDSAIFSTAAATLGIPHSPGFPLWVLIGKLFTWLVPHNPARASNLMCGFFGAGAAAVFYLCARKVLVLLNGSFQGEENQGREYSGSTMELAALGAALVFALSLPVWLQAVRAEVYSLQLVLTLCTLFLALSLYDAERPAQFFLLGVFLWGLSLVVHPLLSVSVLPGFLILGSFRSRSWGGELSKWGWAFGLVATALTLYLFLPLRSAFDPYINWNQPDTWERFWSVVTRKDSWTLSVANTPSNFSYPQFLRLSGFLTAEYTVFLWVLAVLGVLGIAHYLPKIGLGLFILLLSNLGVTLWAAAFSPWNLDLLGYLTFGTAVAALLATVGLFVLFLRLQNKVFLPVFRAQWVIPALTGIGFLFMGHKNFGKANLHDSIWPQKLGQHIMQALPPNAVLFCATDKILTPLWYLQGALGLRPDVTILLNDIFVRPVLAEQSKRRNPDLPIDSEQMYSFTVSGLKQGFKKFTEECPRPLFTQVGNHITDWNNFSPYGYILRHQKDSIDIQAATRQVIEFVNHAYEGRLDFSSREVFGLEVFNWGAYLSRLGVPEAESLVVKAGWLDPENPRIWTDLAKAYMFTGRYTLAENCFKLALSYDPYQGDNYLLLAFVLRQQGKVEEAQKVAAEGDLFTPDKIIIRGRKNEKTGR